MAKKNDKTKSEIVEEDTIETKASEVIIENSNEDIKIEESSIKNLFRLKVNIGFCDKYTKANYEIGDIIEVEKDRFEELINDERRLVTKVYGE